MATYITAQYYVDIAAPVPTPYSFWCYLGFGLGVGLVFYLIIHKFVSAQKDMANAWYAECLSQEEYLNQLKARKEYYIQTATADEYLD